MNQALTSNPCSSRISFDPLADVPHDSGYNFEPLL
jgi:hypothetical protein